MSSVRTSVSTISKAQPSARREPARSLCRGRAVGIALGRGRRSSGSGPGGGGRPAQDSAPARLDSPEPMGSLILVRHATTAASASGPQPGPAQRPAAGRCRARAWPSGSARHSPPSWPSCRTTSCGSSDQPGAALPADGGADRGGARAWPTTRDRGGAGADRDRLRRVGRPDADRVPPRATRSCAPPGRRIPTRRAARTASRAPTSRGRAFPVLDAVEAWLADDRARCAIAVAHNHVIRLRLCAMLGWPMREYRDRRHRRSGLVQPRHLRAATRRSCVA